MIQSQFSELLTRLQVFYDRTEEDMYSEYAPLSATVATTEEPIPWSERESLSSRPISEGAVWGEDWQSGWFHIRGRVPESWRGRSVVIRLNLGGECLVFDKDGCPECGLTSQSVYHALYYKEIYRVTPCAKGGEEIDLWVEAAANNILGPQLFDWNPHPERAVHPSGHSIGSVRRMSLALFNEELHQLRVAFFLLWYFIEGLQKDVQNYRCRQIAFAMSEALDRYCGDPANAGKAYEALKPIFAQRANDSAMTVTAVGHAHTDLGWLWPLRESVRKGARTFASQLRLMERFPEYVFGASQPQLYAFVQEKYPALFAQIKERVAEGRWECQGGMWVEADNNIPSGEALIRQFLYGKNYFRDEFGVEVRNLWLPDVFGYNGNTPQIMRICGCNFFLTQKLSWNPVNTFPHNTFRWIGIDGSEVVTHFPPENNYNSLVMGNGYAQAQNRYQEGNILGEFVSLFGMGDGGGGPNEETLERRRLLENWEGVPHVRCGAAQPVFDRMIAVKDRLPVWHGELYLETHRGTLTTQSRTKRNNRKLEQRLQLVEALCTALLPADEYPRALLDKTWKTLLVNQFHDIIPGSSIRLVYERTERDHAECLAALAACADETGRRAFQTDAKALTFFNSLSCDYERPVELPAERFASCGIDALAAQRESDGRVFAALTLPGYGFKTFECTDGEIPATTVRPDLVLENALARYEFGKDGELLSAVLKETDEEFLAAPGNLLQLYHDKPSIYDAWNVEKWSFGEKNPARVRMIDAPVCESGSVRSVLRLHFTLGSSEFRQEISLARNSAVLEFRTQVEWREKQQWLKVAFPSAIRADAASYDIQYGSIQRSTNDNTSWEQAQFEVCAHRFADLSDRQHGLALMNDCKYGYRIKENVIELSLLRSPLWPDFEADRGHQEFTYALRPHTGNLAESTVRREAAQLNRDPWCFPGMRLPAVAPAMPACVSGEGVSLETVKRAEKSGAVVLRLVETRGRRTCARIRLHAEARKLVLIDAIEWNVEREVIQDPDGCFPLELHPFQIATLRIDA